MKQNHTKLTTNYSLVVQLLFNSIFLSLLKTDEGIEYIPILFSVAVVILSLNITTNFRSS